MVLKFTCIVADMEVLRTFFKLDVLTLYEANVVSSSPQTHLSRGWILQVCILTLGYCRRNGQNGNLEMDNTVEFFLSASL